VAGDQAATGVLFAVAVAGALVCIVGVAVIMYAPRGS
jgi:drug/metabolite transporter superfamily protein YnfA